MKFVRIFFLLVIPVLLLVSFVVLSTGAGSYKVYVIHTGSMTPTIPSGSAVVVHKGHYHVGQVITFTEDRLTVTHRLVSISKSGLTTTKGDANPTDDPWHVPTSEIIGGVVLAPRDVGYWITFFKNPLGLGAIVLAALVLWQIWSLTSGETSGEKVRGKPAHRRPKRTHSRTVPSGHTSVNTREGAASEVAGQSVAQEVEASSAPRGRHAYRGDDPK